MALSGVRPIIMSTALSGNSLPASGPPTHMNFTPVAGGAPGCSDGASICWVLSSHASSASGSRDLSSCIWGISGPASVALRARLMFLGAA